MEVLLLLTIKQNYVQPRNRIKNSSILLKTMFKMIMSNTGLYTWNKYHIVHQLFFYFVIQK